MCGLFGAIGRSLRPGVFTEALSALEYRGYDSAGIAVVTPEQVEAAPKLIKTAGPVSGLEKQAETLPDTVCAGLGHTRWATHGPAVARNAHPHASGPVAIVHNGIIERSDALRAEIAARGGHFHSDTDSEVIAHLIREYLARGQSLATAGASALPHLSGAYAFAALTRSARGPEIFATRRQAPLVIGRSADALYVASDITALVGRADEVFRLPEGASAHMRIDPDAGLCLWTTAAEEVWSPITLTHAEIAKNGHDTFMVKEIREQPDILRRALSMSGDVEAAGARLRAAAGARGQVLLTGCGTSCHAGMLGAYWLGAHARLEAQCHIASELAHRPARPDPDRTGLVLLSQSGETADTLAARRCDTLSGLTCLSVVNVAQSTMAHESDAVVDIGAGPEIGVASTKAFTASLLALLRLALATAGTPPPAPLAEGLARLPDDIEAALAAEEALSSHAGRLSGARSVVFLGRGRMYPVALESCLKFTELTYLPAICHPSGEIKHGPLALIETGFPVILHAPSGSGLDADLSTYAELRARGADVLVLTDDRAATSFAGAGAPPERIVHLPWTQPDLAVFPHAVAGQLIAYHAARHLGRDIDKPRNLAKTVTVG